MKLDETADPVATMVPTFAGQRRILHKLKRGTDLSILSQLSAINQSAHQAMDKTLVFVGDKGPGRIRESERELDVVTLFAFRCWYFNDTKLGLRRELRTRRSKYAAMTAGKT